MRHHHAIVAHTVAAAVFLVLAGLALAPYQYGTVTPFYGFIAGPGLFLGALAGAAWVDGWLMSKATRENAVMREDIRRVASVQGIAVSPAGWHQYVRNTGCDVNGALSDKFVDEHSDRRGMSGNRTSPAARAVGD